MEVADYYRRHGSPPFACTLDASKGFDRCSWKVIFRRLLDRQLPAVAVRALLFIYMEQTAWVVWGPSRRCSSSFRLTNGTRQGSVISPVIWVVYCQDLLDRYAPWVLAATSRVAPSVLQPATQLVASSVVTPLLVSLSTRMTSSC